MTPLPLLAFTLVGDIDHILQLDSERMASINSILALKLTAIFCLIIFPLLLSSINADQNSNFLYDNDAEDQDEEWILDTAFSYDNSRGKSLYVKKIKKGTSCDAKKYNICNGVPANNGTSMLYCCKKHCRNVLGDMNNCGVCGKKCKFGQRCCGGVCTDVVYNPMHCGKCNKACLPGVPCDYGYCGYA